MRNSFVRLQLLTGAAVLGFTCLFSTVTAQAQEYSISELYQLARAKDPALNRAFAQLDMGKAEKDIYRAAFIPRLNGNVARKQFWPTVENYESQDITGHYYGYSYGLTGGVPLLNMAAYYQIGAADANINSADAGVNLARQELMVRLFDTCIRYLKAVGDEKLFRDDMARLAQILDQAQAFRKAGTGDVIAVYEAKARLDSAAADLVKAEGIRKMAQQMLESLSGVTVESVKDITSPENFTAQGEPLDWWLATMQRWNPSIIQARYDLDAATEMRKSAHAGHLPTVTANYGYTVDKGSTFLPDVITEQYYIAMGLSIPIFSGGEISARVRRAAAVEAENRATLKEADEKAVNRLKELYLNLEHNISLHDAYRQKHESAEMKLKAVRKGKEIGTRTSIDLLNAEQDYAVSRRDLSHVRYDIALRRVQLKAVAGTLSEEDMETINR